MFEHVRSNLKIVLAALASTSLLSGVAAAGGETIVVDTITDIVD